MRTHAHLAFQLQDLDVHRRHAAVVLHSTTDAQSGQWGVSRARTAQASTETIVAWWSGHRMALRSAGLLPMQAPCIANLCRHHHASMACRGASAADESEPYQRICQQAVAR